MDKFELRSWLTRIDEIVSRRGIDVVMPVSNWGIRALSEHRTDLGSANKLTQLPAAHVFDTATRKASLAHFLAANEFPHPPSVVVTTGALKLEMFSKLTFPVLAKPSLEESKDDIKRFDDLRELEVYLIEQRAGQEIVVQEFIPGRDLSVNVLCENGQILASTVQHVIVPSSLPYTAANGFEFRCNASAMNIVKRLVEKLSWSGVACVDMRMDLQRETPLVLEINGRYWLSLLGSLRAGVNFPLLACELALGRLPPNQETSNVRYFRGRAYELLSLLGGGQHRVKPSETDLSYSIRDPVFFGSVLAISIAKRLMEKLV